MSDNADTSALRIPLNETPITFRTLQTLIATPTVPTRYKESPTGVQDMYAATLYGRELGIGPMTAISQLFLVNGQASMMGQLMLALVWRAGHQVRIIIDADSSTVVAYRRIDGQLTEVGVVEFTMEDAERAGLLVNENTGTETMTYRKYPKHMLTWRAVSMACRLYFPDVILGVKYVPQELEVQAPNESLPEYVEVDDKTGELAMEAGEINVTEILDAEVVDG